MKKLSLLALLAISIVSCTGRIDKEEYEEIDPTTPATRVFVQGKMVGSNSATKGLAWPYVSEEGWETAQFYIRADGTIPDFTDKSSAYYFGRTPGKDGNNRGKVLTDYPYGHYNDRDYDYEKVGKKTGYNIGLFRYVYDVKGLTPQLAIAEAPLVEDILGDDKSDLEQAIADGKNVAYNTARLEEINALLAKGSEYLNSHVLWYVVKEVARKSGWHVNGIIAEDEPGEPSKIGDNVEIDIHQQEHSTWSEIKTSVHVRTDAGSVKINIPLKPEDIVEQSAFDVRVFKDYYEQGSYSDVTITVSHNDDGIDILIDNIKSELIESYKNTFGDGLTVEIHSFCTNDDKADIWSKLKKSAVVSTGKPVTVIGQITSAYYDELIPVTVMNP